MDHERQTSHDIILSQWVMDFQRAEVGSLALLAGGMVMRQAIFQAGNKSAERPDDYFRLTQRAPEGARPRRRVDRAIEGRRRLS